MAVESSVVAKRVWNMIRVAFFMVRKGGSLKLRKMMMDMNMAMKRGKILSKTLTNFLPHSQRKYPEFGFGDGIGEYEFSCTTSPATPFYIHVMPSKRKNSNAAHHPHHHNTGYFSSIKALPCIQPRCVEDDEDTFSNAIVTSSSNNNNMAFEDHLSQIDEDGVYTNVNTPLSPYCMKSEGGDEVDREAEEFISRFYEQMRLQRQTSFIRYDEMLARGAS